MIVYLGLAVMPLIFSVIVNSLYGTSVEKDRKAKRTYLFLCGTVLFLIIGLRDKYVGSTDSLNYYNNWQALEQLNFSEANIFIKNHQMEPGYLYSVWLLSRFFTNPQWVFVFSGALFSFSVCRFIYINSDNVVLSFIMYICLGLYTFMVQGLRQAIAMSICLFAVEPAKKRKIFKFFLLLGLAWFFHRSSSVFILVYFLFWKEINAKSILQMVIGVCLLLLSTPAIVILGNNIVDRNYEKVVDEGGIIAVIIYLIIISTAILFLPKKKDFLKNEINAVQAKNEAFFLAFTILGCVLYLMRYIGTLALERVSFYFMFGQIIVLPQVIGKFNLKSKRIIEMIAIILSILLFLYRLTGSDLIPYNFFWE